MDAWAFAVAVADGRVFRPVNGADRVGGEALSEKVVWQLSSLRRNCRGPWHRAA